MPNVQQWEAAIASGSWLPGGGCARCVELAWPSGGLLAAVGKVAVELAEPGGVGEDVDFGDLAVSDGEGHDRGHLSAHGAGKCP